MNKLGFLLGALIFAALMGGAGYYLAPNDSNVALAVVWASIGAFAGGVVGGAGKHQLR